MHNDLYGEVKTFLASTMEEAVEHAWHMADDGDVVLLSPACSSLDMFSDYVERGNAFQNAINSIMLRMNAGREEKVIAG